MISDLSKICIGTRHSIKDAIVCIDSNIAKVALVVDDQFRLLDTITDGDVRRAVLAGEALDCPVSVLRDRKAANNHPEPITGFITATRTALLKIMREGSVRQLPLLDEDMRVVGLTTMNELAPTSELPLRAVVMAGGYGKRLRPLTDETPKPMLPVGNRPLLEVIIQQLHKAGIRDVNLTTHYKRDAITNHFGDGSEFGVNIEYIEEDDPMGTAGAIGRIDDSDDVLLVINGDILTGMDFKAMTDFHLEHEAMMTVAVREHELQLPYGVVHGNGVIITEIVEKPVIRNFVNAGVYLLNPEVRRKIPRTKPYDMPELIEMLIRDHGRVVSFPIHEYWLDIGEAGDYAKAMADFDSLYPPESL